MSSSSTNKNDGGARERELLRMLAGIGEFVVAEEEDLRRQVQEAEAELAALEKANEELREAAKERKARKDEVAARKAAMEKKGETSVRAYTAKLLKRVAEAGEKEARFERELEAKKAKKAK